MTKQSHIQWSNPNHVDLSVPYLYLIRIRSEESEYRYIGKGSKPSRMDAYNRNVGRVLLGQPKRPAIKKNGDPQSEGNVKFRYVHLVLAVAVQRGWQVEHFPLENCSKENHTKIEKLRIDEYQCNLNSKESWFVENFEQLAQDIR